MAKKVPKTKAGKKAKVEKVMQEYKKGALRSGSKEGPKVKARKQAVAIALSQSGQSAKKKKPTEHATRKNVEEQLS